jgi:glutamyl-tRNA synthetase
VAQIIESLAWLGLSPDAPPVMQSTREARHAEVAHALLAAGRAYRAYETADELKAMREAAQAEGRPPHYNGYWRDRTPGPAEAEKPFAIRIKAPREGSTVVNDLVQGRVEVRNAELDDMIILRSDGTPTYLHAVVVDDHDMEITHVIRGDDHLTNAARQKQIYEALGWDVPSMAHIPLIHGQDGAKLSKRHGALGVEQYRALGFLPAALRNYLVRLGWSQGDREFFSTEEMIEAFDLANVGRSAARFDLVKLENMNGHYMRAAPDAELTQILIETLPYLTGGDEMLAKLDDAMRAKLVKAMPGLKERAKTLVELVDGAKFLHAARPLEMDAKAQEILSKGREHLPALIARLEAVTSWTAADTEAAVRAYAEETEAKLGQVAQPLRAALTGRGTSPGIFDVLEVLGRDESLNRLRDQAVA